jgi:hypothetical protein
MLSGALARNLALVLMLLGLLAVATPGRCIDRLDRRFMLAAAVLPAAYVLNMAVLGWNMRVFDRPAHLLWAIPVYLLVRRCGLSSRALLAGFAAAGLAAGGVALLAKSELFGGPLMRLEFGRPMGPFSSPGPFGNYSAVIAMACLAGWLGGAGLRGGRWVRLAALLGVSGGLVASLLSETRSAWASLPVMALVAATVLVGAGRLAGAVWPPWWRRSCWWRGCWRWTPCTSGCCWGRTKSGPIWPIPPLQRPARRRWGCACSAGSGAGSSSWPTRCWASAWPTSAPPSTRPWRPGPCRRCCATSTAAQPAGRPPHHHRPGRHAGDAGVLGGHVPPFRAARRGADGPRRLFAGWGLMVLAAELVFASVGSMFASSLGTVAFTVLLAVCAAGAHPATPERG